MQHQHQDLLLVHLLLVYKMSLTNSKLSVETISPEGNSTYYVTLQPDTKGKSAVDYVSPLLTFNTGLNQFFVNNTVVPTSNVVSLGSSVSSLTPPTNPNVGDLWYDIGTDTQFEYVSDGINRQWIDITGPTMSIGGPISTNTVTYVPFSATANPITTRSFNSGDLVGFSTFTSVSGGYPYVPYTYYVASGTLPTGLTLNSSTGIVTGIAGRAIAATNVVFGVRDATSSAVTTTVTFSISVTIQYLAVAGGGGGGADRGSGGGAGGLLTSNWSLAASVPITITVGVGGAAGGPALQAANGVSSNISSPAFTQVTTIGGGSGAIVNNSVNTCQRNGVDGARGGSGGGASGQGLGNPSSPRAGTAGAGIGYPGIFGVTQQGSPGGLSSSAGPTQVAAGGGGGATGVGGNATTAFPTNTKIAGAGGAGYQWPFTANTYAGGGGGSSDSRCGSFVPGTGGPGGGGPGGAPGVAGTPGTASTGGGGGGGSGGTPQTNGGTGGSGVVILAMPTPGYPGTAVGAIVTTPPAAPGFTVLTYNTPNPTTPGSFTFTT